MTTRVGAFFVLIMLAGIVVACAAATPQSKTSSMTTTANGGTFIRAITSEPAIIDPQGAPNSGLSVVLPYLFDTLVVRDLDNKILPHLAESWQVASDGKAITMKLRAGVTFQDGAPFNADAVRFTFQRFKDAGTKSPIYENVKQIGGIESMDDLTVRFTFAQPTANFWSTVTMPYAGIISPASARKVAETGKGYLVGTGAFALAEWRAGQSLTLKRNPAYAWGAAVTQNRAAPYLDTVVLKVIPDATTQLAALQAGEVDAIFINQPEHRLKLQNDASVHLQETVLNSLIFLGFNTSKPPFDDARVRRALSHAINKEEIVSVALGGLGKVAYAPLAPTIPGFDPQLKQYELQYDAKQAQTLLSQAGFVKASDGTWTRNGQSLKGVLLTSNRAPNDSIATLLQSQLKAIGVGVEIRQLDSKAVMTASNEGQFDFLLWRYDWNDADALNIFLGSDRIGSTNRVGYRNAQVDALFAQAAHELTEAKRWSIYFEAQKMIMQDAPWQPLYAPLDVMVLSNRVEGVKIGYMGRMLLNDAQVVKQ
ncbi:MAG: ABC transporter substrate-binding protein [Chloroflexi bacterium]|nr:ABC transporter substrate-binding protein [Chloroflexota bacterium]